MDEYRFGIWRRRSLLLARVIAVLLVSIPLEAATNLALNRPVRSSSDESASLVAKYAVDGSTSTRWSSAFSEPQWIEVDLGSRYLIQQVQLNWEAAYAEAFQLQASDDRTTWTDFYATTTGQGGVQTITPQSPPTARYVRVYCTRRTYVYGSYWGFSLWEIQIFGTAPPGSTHTLTVTASGNGSVTSSPAGIDCPASICSASFSAGSTVQLTATPATNATFNGWSGACSGTGSCTVTMNGDVTVGASFSAAVPPDPFPSVGNTALKRLRVASWNVQHGYTANGTHDEQGQIDLLATLGADVVILQEIATWDNPNMPQTYIDGMTKKTGRKWTGYFQQTVPGTTGEGDLIMTWLPVDYHDSVLFDSNPSSPSELDSHRSAVRIQVTVNSVPLQITGTHLAVNATYRLDQIKKLRTFVESQPRERIVGGDFNAEPQDSATWTAWGSAFSDIWLLLAAPGDKGFTMPLRQTTGAPGRLDYWFSDSAKAAPVGISMVQTKRSDHNPIVADYQVK